MTLIRGLGVSKEEAYNLWIASNKHDGYKGGWGESMAVD